jgi:hypothetical protein
MSIDLRSCRKAFGLAALTALLSGCGSNQSSGSLFPAARSVSHPVKAEALSRADLLYVTDSHDNDAYVISLPSGKLVGKLTGFNQPLGECLDRNADVFIVDAQDSEIRAYRHNARSAFRVLNDHPWIPVGCAIDPTTGNLTVANCCGQSADGSLAIYPRAQGSPKYYQEPGIKAYWYCAYDSQGNLFVSALGNTSYNYQLLEIPHGGSGFVHVTLHPSITGDVSLPLFWDGTYLAIAGTKPGTIYQFKISGSSGTRVHIIKLDGVTGVGEFWIQASGTSQILYATIVQNSIVSVGVYHYPAGGKPITKLYDVVTPFGVAVSIRPT